MTRRLLLAALFLVLAAVPARAQQPQVIVDKAKAAVDSILLDPNFSDLKTYLKGAKGVMVVPSLVKAGLIIGGEAGEAVVLAWDPNKGWSDPAFYYLAAGSIGFQIGVEAKEIIVIIRTEKGLTSLLSSQVKLGGDVSITAGTIGGGVAAGTVGSLTADLLAFSKAKGLFGGGSLDGGIIKTSPDENTAYYGKEVTPREVLVERTVSNAGAAGLKASLSRN
jgi:SH3 domain-containing YSC84-like protein 1